VSRSYAARAVSLGICPTEEAARALPRATLREYVLGVESGRLRLITGSDVAFWSRHPHSTVTVLGGWS